ncbi:universal stress protein [Saccharopolyspora sp. WRP15-2]|uniref:Universal stress protein n=1 Tax=Saccharopolyspora oryzae TaxID=2997343 RepID=A0ABT4V2H5_9PSEU|nr:universal stress protein [Saccharopolyspora oryzae]MDA3628162.1 universal stress protein [Saccharopolyspora oryzae]
MGAGSHREAVVVGVDGSEASVRALRWALVEARRRCLPVHAIMAWESRAVLAGPGPLLMRPDQTPHDVRERHWQSLNRVARVSLAGATTPELHVELVEGDAAEVLTERSAHAGLLVLGDSGRSRVSEALLGGTALKCIHEARCPVLIVPARMPVGFDEQTSPGAAATDPVLG